MPSRREVIEFAAASVVGHLIPGSCSAAPLPQNALIEVNLAGYENTGAIPGKNYNLPTARTLRYFAAHGIATVRLPMYWARLQPIVAGALSPSHAAELERFLRMATTLGIRVIVDLHGFGRRDDEILGTPALPIAALVDFWERFARRFAGLCHGIDPMNEPHDMPTTRTWPDAAQAVVDAIRRHDRSVYCYIEGDDWSNAARWQINNADLAICDPADRLIYSAHIYFDRDTSGQYRVPFDQDGADPEIGAERLAPFVDWLRTRKLRGHIGEFGVPYRDPRWLAVLDHFVQAVADARDVLTGAAYWTAGEWLDFYDLSLQPTERGGRLIDQPQMKILTRPR